MPRTSSSVTSCDAHRADELAVLHHDDPVAEVEHVVDVVADQEDAEALGLELLDRARRPSGVSWTPSAAVGSSMIRMRALK